MYAHTASCYFHYYDYYMLLCSTPAPLFASAPAAPL